MLNRKRVDLVLEQDEGIGGRVRALDDDSVNLLHRLLYSKGGSLLANMAPVVGVDVPVRDDETQLLHHLGTGIGAATLGGTHVARTDTAVGKHHIRGSRDLALHLGFGHQIEVAVGIRVRSQLVTMLEHLLEGALLLESLVDHLAAERYGGVRRNEDNAGLDQLIVVLTAEVCLN